LEESSRKRKRMEGTNLSPMKTTPLKETHREYVRGNDTRSRWSSTPRKQDQKTFGKNIRELPDAKPEVHISSGDVREARQGNLKRF